MKRDPQTRVDLTAKGKRVMQLLRQGVEFDEAESMSETEFRLAVYRMANRPRPRRRWVGGLQMERRRRL